MFDKLKRKKFDEATVGDLIKFLENLLRKQEYYFREIPKGIFTWKRTCLRFLLMIMIWTISTVTMKIDGGDNVESYRR